MTKPTLTPIAQQDFIAAVHAVAAMIGADGWRPDLIIGIGRGGLVPAVYLSHATGLPMLSIDRSGTVPDLADELLVRLAARTRAGDRLLLVDDINDTGRTIAHIRRAMAAAGAARGQVRVATLLDNVHSAERVDYAARVIDRAVTKDWFVFPWETMASDAAITDDALLVPERTA